MKYNYVVFNFPDGGFWSTDENGYYSICMKDLKDMPGVKVSGSPLDHRTKLVRLLYKIHISDKLNRFIKLPCKEKWYPYYFDTKFEDSKPFCFVLISNPPLDYLKYLKNKYPDAKFVKFYRDLIHTQQRSYDEYTKSNIIDFIVTYDEIEAERYGIKYYHEVESKITLESDNTIKYDIFFAGRAKNRLPKLIDTYDYLESKGIKCFFFLTGVKQEDRVYRQGIQYSDKQMKYKEMLLHNTHARCLLEINQEDAVGYTSRFIEAVMYNKKLLTDNTHIKNTSFYNTGFIQCFTDISEIDSTFVTKDDIVDYHYEDFFSPVGFINYLENDLL